MRKFLLFGALGLMALITSCSQSEEIFYSCDKTQDEWVKENLSEIRQMTRSEWLQVDKSMAAPIYRAFTPQQRIDFWRERFDEIMELPWNDAELAHIQSLVDFMNSNLHIFQGNLSVEDEDAMDLFAYKWQQYAVEQLGWEEKVGLTIMMSGDKLKNTKGDIEETSIGLYSKAVLSTRSEDFSEFFDCNCHYANVLTKCFPSMRCEKNGCNYLETGCGLLMGKSCDGLCV